MRLLLFPDPIAPGGGAPPSEPPPGTPPGGPPVPAPPPTPAPAPPPTPLGPAITDAELHRLRTAEAEASRLRDAETQRQAAARQAEIDAAAKKGQWDQVLALKDADLKSAQQRIAETEARTQRYALDSALVGGLAGYAFVSPEWPATLRDNLRAQFRVFQVGETYEVRHAVTGQTVADWLKAEMAKPMYAGILASTAKPGAPKLDALGRPLAPSGPAAPDMDRWLQRQKAQHDAGGGMLGIVG